MSDPKIRAEDVIGHAEAAALFFRTLLDEKVPMPAAVQMTTSYVGALLMKAHFDAGNQEPPKPWEGLG